MNSPTPEDHPDAAFVSALTNLQSRLRGYCQAALGHSDEAAEALQRTNITLWYYPDFARNRLWIYKGF